MKVIFYIFLLYIFSGIFCLLHSQQTDYRAVIEDMLEELAASDIEFDYSAVYDDLESFIASPLNINTASSEELQRLYVLNEIHISNLLDYRTVNERFVTVYELQYVEGFTWDIIRKILPFITVADPAHPPVIRDVSSLRHGRHQFFIRGQQILQEQKGYSPISDSALAENPNARYLGSPLKLYTRYQYNLGRRIYWGFVAEKDQGEEMFSGSNPRGMDYHSFHLQINNAGRFKTIALGDYQMQFGQGLISWSGFSFGKSASVLNISENPRGINKYSSTDENMFMRGAGVTYSLSDKTDLSLFYSSKKIDARISETDSLGNIREASSLPRTGLHATPSQVEHKNVLDETILGGDITYNHRHFRIGMTAMHYYFGAPVNQTFNRYNQFAFRGRENTNAGINYRFSLMDMRFFGEVATSGSGRAIISGFLWDLSSRLNIGLLYRDYDRDYHTRYGNAFSEGTSPVNEKGIYAGAELYIMQRLKVSAYYDTYNFPWLRYGIYTPSRGTDFLLQADFSLSPDLQMYSRIRHRSKPANSPAGEGNIRKPVNTGDTRLRFHINYQILSSLEFRNRLEHAWYVKEGENRERGFLIYQDILWRPQSFPLSVALRYAVFDTDSYNTRMYAYENDVLYAFSFPPYFDRGYRSYLTARYSVSNSVDLWLRYALTVLPGRDSIGTGLNEITGNRRSEAKAQLRIRF